MLLLYNWGCYSFHLHFLPAAEHIKLTPVLWLSFKAILGRNYVKAQAKVEVDEAF